MKKIILTLAIILCAAQVSFAVDSNVNYLGNSSNLNVNVNNVHGPMNGAVGQVDWANFNKGSLQSPGSVNFGFSGANQTVINRVLNGSQSIEAKLKDFTPNPAVFGSVGKVEWSTVAPQAQPNLDFQPQAQTVLDRNIAPSADIAGKLNLNDLNIQKNTVNNVTTTVIKLNY